MQKLKQIIAKHPHSLLQLSKRMFPKAMKRGDAFLVFSRSDRLPGLGHEVGRDSRRTF
ncbi:MAG: hypothetical protein U5K69_29845 [Balneolaceae bacterium]|nr:hypothetical protein [Balneolaceae bacterium]